MAVISFNITFVLSIFIIVISSSQADNEVLQLVHVFFRHGSRTPELHHTYPNDPYKSDAFEPMGYGQLTNIGKQRAYKLGKLLRQRYDSLLGDIYLPELVLATSTDFDRTKMSALLALAGLFRPTPSQIWDDEVSWMPIPYHYDKNEVDFTLRRPNVYCPVYLKELEEVLASADVQRYMKANSDVLKYIEKNSGVPMNNLNSVFGLYQTLNAEENLNFTLPEWTKSIYPDEIRKLASKQCELENSNDVLKRLNGGRMLAKVVENMIEKSTNTLYPQGRKMFLYSGHENNVINILAALDLYETHFPKYSSAVLIELLYRPSDDSHFVKVLYARDIDAEPEELVMDNCDVLCPLDQFVKIVEPHVPVNYTAECESNISLD